MSSLMLGDIEGARKQVAQLEGGAERWRFQAGHCLVQAAWNGKLEAVRALLAFGVPVGATGMRGETALHNACWRGFEAVVVELLGAGAPLEIEERAYHATPLGWAIHGSMNCAGGAVGAYPGIVRRLLAAGAVIRPGMIPPDPEALPKGLRGVLQV